MLQIFIEDSGKSKQSKNGGKIGNTTGSYLVSCQVISRPATVNDWGKVVLVLYILSKRRTKLVLF